MVLHKILMEGALLSVLSLLIGVIFIILHETKILQFLSPVRLYNKWKYRRMHANSLYIDSKFNIRCIERTLTGKPRIRIEAKNFDVLYLEFSEINELVMALITYQYMATKSK